MKTQLFAQLPETSFKVIIAENHTNLQWQDDDGKEFVLNGEMYDVAKIKKKNGKTELYCLLDKKEKELLKNFAKAMKSESSNGKSGKSSVKFQLPDYIAQPQEKTAGITCLSIHTYATYNSALSCAVKEINAPPPRA